MISFLARLSTISGIFADSENHHKVMGEKDEITGEDELMKVYT